MNFANHMSLHEDPEPQMRSQPWSAPDYSLWDTEQITQVFHAWTPDPRKLWDNKCVLFKAAKIICYKAIENMYLISSKISPFKNHSILFPPSNPFITLDLF